MKGLLECLRGCYTVTAVSAPSAGRLTWDAEGGEGGRYHSRRLHVPNSNSGLTVGRGYDLRYRLRASVQKDLADAGVASDIALKISAAAGKWGIAASQVVIDNDLLDCEISGNTQLQLFSKVYEEYVREAKRVMNAYAKTSDMTLNWGKLDSKILDVLVDLRYRGDLTRTSSAVLLKHVANNDLAKFKSEMSKQSNWTTVPLDRFTRRKDYIATPQQVARLQAVSGPVVV